MRLKVQRRNKQPEMYGAGINSAEITGAETRSAETNSADTHSAKTHRAETNSVKMRSAKMRTVKIAQRTDTQCRIIRIDQASLRKIRLLQA